MQQDFQKPFINPQNLDVPINIFVEFVCCISFPPKQMTKNPSDLSGNLLALTFAALPFPSKLEEIEVCKTDYLCLGLSRLLQPTRFHPGQRKTTLEILNEAAKRSHSNTNY
jgi:hypothetical protein